MAGEGSQSARALNLQRWKSDFVCFGLIFFFFFSFYASSLVLLFFQEGLLYILNLCSRTRFAPKRQITKSPSFLAVRSLLCASKKKWKKEEIDISEPHGALGMSHLSFSQSCERHANIFSFFNARRTLPKSRDSLQPIEEVTIIYYCEENMQRGFFIPLLSIIMVALLHIGVFYK